MKSASTHLQDLRHEAAVVLDEIHQIMAVEGDENSIAGIGNALALVKQEHRGDVAVLRELISVYDTLHRGPGGFGDYFIWREDVEERRRANQRHKELTTRLSEIVEEARSLVRGHV